MCDFKFNDGGRSKYFKGKGAGDCVPRAIAIATGKDYKEVYNAMANGMMGIGEQRSARNGVKKKVDILFFCKIIFRRTIVLHERRFS